MPRNIVKNKNIYVNLSGTKYDVIKHIARESFNWTIKTKYRYSKKANISWVDTYINEEELMQMRPFQKINHFPGSANLGRKNLLGKNLVKLRNKFPQEYDFYPKTFLLPCQAEDLRVYAQLFQKKWFIGKPEASCQGRGIQLIKKVDNPELLQSHVVVQEYVTSPLLIDKLKFDLRIYVLIKSISPLKIFMYREGLARFATEEYSKPSKHNMSDLCMHLTNYAVNKKSEKYSRNEDEAKDGEGHKRSISSVWKLLQEQGHDVDLIVMKIRQLIIKTICAVQPYLAHFYRTARPANENLEIAFELLGFDILLDSQLNPLLIEVNHTPSFATDSPLDWNIKKHLILDTLILMNIQQKDKKIFQELNNNHLMASKKIQKLSGKQPTQIVSYEDLNSGGYLKIYPSQDDHLNDRYIEFINASKQSWDDFTMRKVPSNRSQSAQIKDKDINIKVPAIMSPLVQSHYSKKTDQHQKFAFQTQALNSLPDTSSHNLSIEGKDKYNNQSQTQTEPQQELTCKEVNYQKLMISKRIAQIQARQLQEQNANNLYPTQTLLQQQQQLKLIQKIMSSGDRLKKPRGQNYSMLIRPKTVSIVGGGLSCDTSKIAPADISKAIYKLGYQGQNHPQIKSYNNPQQLNQQNCQQIQFKNINRQYKRTQSSNKYVPYQKNQQQQSRSPINPMNPLQYFGLEGKSPLLKRVNSSADIGSSLSTKQEGGEMKREVKYDYNFKKYVQMQSQNSQKKLLQFNLNSSDSSQTNSNICDQNVNANQFAWFAKGDAPPILNKASTHEKYKKDKKEQQYLSVKNQINNIVRGKPPIPNKLPNERKRQHSLSTFQTNQKTVYQQCGKQFVPIYEPMAINKQIQTCNLFSEDKEKNQLLSEYQIFEKQKNIEVANNFLKNQFKTQFKKKPSSLIQEDNQKFQDQDIGLLQMSGSKKMLSNSKFTPSLPENATNMNKSKTVFNLHQDNNTISNKPNSLLQLKNMTPSIFQLSEQINN